MAPDREQLLEYENHARNTRVASLTKRGRIMSGPAVCSGAPRTETKQQPPSRGAHRDRTAEHVHGKKSIEGGQEPTTSRFAGNPPARHLRDDRVRARQFIPRGGKLIPRSSIVRVFRPAARTCRNPSAGNNAGNSTYIRMIKQWRIRGMEMGKVVADSRCSGPDRGFAGAL